ncbi:Ig-like domain repeat protein [Leucobacter weissii]|uniref:Ig-like domain repeat protein n=1 Tax=Leucobacter weissii TaxID=1983706 RepID=A0A939MKL5_9MICO|nr:Ig-like domain-containing protein [Leucobacter weissii]MBO1900367.1 Ig-like domain repeat protein [Leucobacter weissii]
MSDRTMDRTTARKRGAKSPRGVPGGGHERARRIASRGVLAPMLALALAATGLVAAASPATAGEGQTVFTASLSTQNWTVPGGVDRVTVDLQGAAGGDGGRAGGAGGRGGVGTVALAVSPGQQLSFSVGYRGAHGSSDKDAYGTGGGPSAARGGNGNTGAGVFLIGGEGGSGAGGGSATVVRLDGAVVAVAGGGGGGGGRGAFDGHGGAGGDAGAGGGSGGGSGTGGGGASGATGELPGWGGGNGSSGSGGGGGGGGGGGRYGGTGGGGGGTGGGGGGGGGGGQNYVDTQLATLVSEWNAGSSADGRVVLSWVQTFGSSTALAAPAQLVVGEAARYDVAVTSDAEILSGEVVLGAVEQTSGETVQLGTRPLAEGAATIRSDALRTPGVYTLTARFEPVAGGDVVASQATSELVVVKGDTAVLLGAPLDPPAYGDEVVLSATVSAAAPAQGVPTGLVGFYTAAGRIGDPVAVDAEGRASIATARLPVGDLVLEARYEGDRGFNAATSQSVALTVNPGDVEVDLVSEFNPVTVGEESVFAVRVGPTRAGAPAPQGQVRFQAGGEDLGDPVVLDSRGRAEFATDGLEPGVHRISAHYEGSDSYAPARSARLEHVVNPGDATVRLSSPVNPRQAGEEVVLRVGVAAERPATGIPGGQVQLHINGAAFGGPVDLDAQGTAEVTTTALPVGENSVLVAYLGDGRFDPAASAPLIQVIEAQPPSVVLSADTKRPFRGADLTLSATVSVPSGSLPGGAVTFLDRGRPIATVPVDSGGRAKLSTAKLATGTHQLGATYRGDAATRPGTSNTVTVTVRPRNVKVTVYATRVASYAGQPWYVRARVDARAAGAGTPRGKVQFTSNGKRIGKPVPVSDTRLGSRILKGLKPGRYRIVGEFIPAKSSGFERSTSNQLVHTVRSGTANARVSLRSHRLAKGAYRFTVRVAPKRAGQSTVRGRVVVAVDGAEVGSARVSRTGVARITVRGLEPGRADVVTAYQGSKPMKPASTSRTVRIR